jgi:hypothetical protein
MFMQLYPHWLDGEYVRIATKSTGPQQNVEEMIRALKLHALLGTEFILSDVQIFDSAAILELFADPEFCKFVEKDRSFLDLLVDPDPDLGTHAFALAARGLTRTLNPGWTSSVFFGDPAPIQHLAKEIIDEVVRHNCIRSTWIGAADLNYPQYQKQFQAIRQAVFYFGMHDEAKKLQAPIGERLDYYQILKCAFDKLGQHIDQQSRLSEINTDPGRKWLAKAQEDLVNLESTILFIDAHIEDPDKRKARSQVHAILGRESDVRQREWMWNNVVQAWNYSAEQTIRPDGGSIGMLPGAVSPAQYLDLPTDVLIPVDFRQLVKPINCDAELPVLPIDLNQITWSEIAKARKETAEGSLRELSRVRAEYRGNIAAISPALRVHLKALGKILRPPKDISSIPYFLFSGGAISSTAIAAFGNVDLSANGNLVVISSGAAALTFRMAGQIFGDSETWRQRRALTNTLFQAATGQPK